MVGEHLMEVREYWGEGYRPLVDFGAWRVAILRYSEELLPENIKDMQRHNETDEVFVLLAGKCILFIGEGGEKVEQVFAEDLEPNKLYNVKKACWHNHTLDHDAVVLIVENVDTTAENSSNVGLSNEQARMVMNLTQTAWGSKTS
jgi:hypothetical protein